ncbi:hypothetical protein [Moraxella marmotae]|uniref:hypothetical protein n=1 Tax=Moraxella marmotae TaxID=3344520 RepID=UPI0035F4FB72
MVYNILNSNKFLQVNAIVRHILTPYDTQIQELKTQLLNQHYELTHAHGALYKGDLIHPDRAWTTLKPLPASLAPLADAYLACVKEHETAYKKLTAYLNKMMRADGTKHLLFWLPKQTAVSYNPDYRGGTTETIPDEITTILAQAQLLRSLYA